MNVATLRERLEQLERSGYGATEIDVGPSRELHPGSGRFVVAFDFVEYGVCDVEAGTTPDDGVTLRFDRSAV